MSSDLRWLLMPVALNGAVEVRLPFPALHTGSRPADGPVAGSVERGQHGWRTLVQLCSWNSSFGTRYFVLLVMALGCTLPLLAAGSLIGAAICRFLANLAVAPAFSCQYAPVAQLAEPGMKTKPSAGRQPHSSAAWPPDPLSEAPSPPGRG